MKDDDKYQEFLIYIFNTNPYSYNKIYWNNISFCHMSAISKNNIKNPVIICQIFIVSSLTTSAADLMVAQKICFDVNRRPSAWTSLLMMDQKISNGWDPERQAATTSNFQFVCHKSPDILRWHWQRGRERCHAWLIEFIEVTAVCLLSMYQRTLLGNCSRRLRSIYRLQAPGLG